MSNVIDLSYVKIEQEKFSKYLENVKGIKYQESKFKVTQSQILTLCSELYEVVNEAKIHKAYDKEVNNDRLLEELSDCLSWIGNISNNLDIDLFIETELRQATNIESQIIMLNYDILRFNKIDDTSINRRRIKEVIVPEFLNIVYSFGFSLEDLKKAYFRKMKSNYENPKFK